MDAFRAWTRSRIAVVHPGLVPHADQHACPMQPGQHDRRCVPSWPIQTIVQINRPPGHPDSAIRIASDASTAAPE